MGAQTEGNGEQELLGRLQQAKAADDSVRAGALEVGIVWRLLDREAFTEALPYAEDAVQRLRGVHGERLYCCALLNLAKVNQALRNTGAAIDGYEAALHEEESEGHGHRLQDIHNELGLLFRAHGKVEDARRHFKLAISIIGDEPQSGEDVAAFFNLAALDHAEGQVETGGALLQRVPLALIPTNVRSDAGWMLTEAGRSHRTRDDFSAALALYQRALDAYADEEIGGRRIFTECFFATVLKLTGELSAAASHFRLALRSIEGAEETYPGQRSAVINDLAEIAIDQGDFDGAEAYLEQARSLALGDADAERVAKVHETLARLAERRHDEAGARRHKAQSWRWACVHGVAPAMEKMLQTSKAPMWTWVVGVATDGRFHPIEESLLAGTMPTPGEVKRLRKALQAAYASTVVIASGTLTFAAGTLDSPVRLEPREPKRAAAVHVVDSEAVLAVKGEVRWGPDPPRIETWGVITEQRVVAGGSGPYPGAVLCAAEALQPPAHRRRSWLPWA
jgi:tetratricopeptide (TPR) repeat protein